MVTNFKMAVDSKMMIFKHHMSQSEKSRLTEKRSLDLTSAYRGARVVECPQNAIEFRKLLVECDRLEQLKHKANRKLNHDMHMVRVAQNKMRMMSKTGVYDYGQDDIDVDVYDDRLVGSRYRANGELRNDPHGLYSLDQNEKCQIDEPEVDHREPDISPRRSISKPPVKPVVSPTLPIVDSDNEVDLHRSCSQCTEQNLEIISNHSEEKDEDGQVPEDVRMKRDLKNIQKEMEEITNYLDTIKKTQRSYTNKKSFLRAHSHDDPYILLCEIANESNADDRFALAPGSTNFGHTPKVRKPNAKRGITKNGCCHSRCVACEFNLKLESDKDKQLNKSASERKAGPVWHRGPSGMFLGTAYSKYKMKTKASDVGSQSHQEKLDHQPEGKKQSDNICIRKKRSSKIAWEESVSDNTGRGKKCQLDKGKDGFAGGIKREYSQPNVQAISVPNIRPFSNEMTASSDMDIASKSVPAMKTKSPSSKNISSRKKTTKAKIGGKVDSTSPRSQVKDTESMFWDVMTRATISSRHLIEGGRRTSVPHCTPGQSATSSYAQRRNSASLAHEKRNSFLREKLRATSMVCKSRVDAFVQDLDALSSARKREEQENDLKLAALRHRKKMELEERKEQQLAEQRRKEEEECKKKEKEEEERRNKASSAGESMSFRYMRAVYGGSGMSLQSAFQKLRQLSHSRQ